MPHIYGLPSDFEEKAEKSPSLKWGDSVFVTESVAVQRLTSSIHVERLQLKVGDTGTFLRYTDHPQKGTRAFVEFPWGRFNVPLDFVASTPPLTRSRFEIMEDM